MLTRKTRRRARKIAEQYGDTTDHRIGQIEDYPRDKILAAAKRLLPESIKVARKVVKRFAKDKKSRPKK